MSKEHFHPERLSLVTLGVQDLARARAFYEAIGLKAAAASQGDVVFFKMAGLVLSLYPRSLLAEDAQVSAEGSGFSGISLARNLDSPADVDAAIAEAVAAGATLVKAGQPVFWGGYSGYFADPDGHLWEVAHNPYMPFDDRNIPILE